MRYKEAREKRSEKRAKKRFSGFQKLCFVYLFAVFGLPQYFGVPLPGFALTAQRIAMVCLFFSICLSRKRVDDFLSSTTGAMIGPVAVLAPFLFVTLITAVLRSDPNSFLYFFVDAFLPMLLMMYIAAKVISLEELLKLFKLILVVVCLSCYLDALILHWNPYQLLHTIASIGGGSVYRASSYRVAAMASHPIALGIYLVLMTPLMCIDLKRKRINIGENWFLLLLICGSMLLCGSRMPQATFLVELLFLFLLTDREAKRVLVPYVMVVGTLLVLLVVLLHDEQHVRRYIILNVYQMIDSVFGTKLVLEEFGYWQWAYIQSWDYRNLLPLLFFSDDYDPILGLGITLANRSGSSIFIGGRTVSSIDNYYVMAYLQFAWPGLIAIGSALLYTVARCIAGIKKGGGGLVCKMLFASLFLYLVNLWFVADLGTFKYAFSLFGLAYVYSKGAGILQKEPSDCEFAEKAGGGTHQYLDARFKGVKGAQNRFLEG
ncbi:MAG: hypothetical protein Q4B45_07395 [Coriobacteriia bacterium]|nr:hypothetical protein [Coriobacteriia bacterium]